MTLGENIILRTARRAPDFLIGGVDRPYMRRWWIVRTPLLCIYLHHFLRSDDDRALHDHPWSNLSVLLRGSYTEHTIAAGGIERRAVRNAGDWKLRASGRMAHRIDLHDGDCWTLFITGPRYRQWGFHCPQAGWVHWKRFTADDDKGAVGRGCDA